MSPLRMAVTEKQLLKALGLDQLPQAGANSTTDVQKDRERNIMAPRRGSSGSSADMQSPPEQARVEEERKRAGEQARLEEENEPAAEQARLEETHERSEQIRWEEAHRIVEQSQNREEHYKFP